MRLQTPLVARVVEKRLASQFGNVPPEAEELQALVWQLKQLEGGGLRR